VKTNQDPFEAEFGDLQGPTHWPSLLPDQARLAWADLRDWSSIWSTGSAWRPRVVPPCWYRHNTFVEALSALRDHERISFATSTSPTAPVDWFRALREIEHRLSEAAHGPSARSTSTDLTLREPGVRIKPSGRPSSGRTSATANSASSTKASLAAEDGISAVTRPTITVRASLGSSSRRNTPRI
jgi:hypothetical protein